VREKEGGWKVDVVGDDGESWWSGGGRGRGKCGGEGIWVRDVEGLAGRRGIEVELFVVVTGKGGVDRRGCVEYVNERRVREKAGRRRGWFKGGWRGGGEAKEWLVLGYKGELKGEGVRR